MGGSTFIQVWMVLSEYCEQFQRWGVSNQWECTARTFENFASNRISNKFQFDLLHTNCSHTQSDHNNYYTPANKHYTHTFLVKDWGLVIVSGLLASGCLTDFFSLSSNLDLDVCGSECYVQLSSQMNCTNIYNKGWPMGAQYFKPIGGQCILSNQRAVLILLYDWTKSNRNILHSHWLLLL